MTYQTTAAYLSGAVCGAMWMGGKGGLPLNANLRPEFARQSEPASFRDVLLSILSEKGGDFQGPAFTADSVVRIERIGQDARGFRSVHVRELDLTAIGCGDLVDADAYVGDFLGEDF
jgi:hypothetical protein